MPSMVNVMPAKEVKISSLITAIIFFCFLVFPVARLLLQTLQSDESISLYNVQTVLAQKSFFTSLSNSFLISGASALVTVFLAFLLAYTVNCTDIPKGLKNFVTVMVSVPMLFPTITYGFAIIYSFGKQGLITAAIGHPLFDIYGFWGMLMGYVTYTLPTAFLLLHNTFKYIDKKYLIVSELMGDSAIRRFAVTILRPMIATVGAAFIQSFFLCFTDFGIPATVGGEFSVIATILYNQMLGALPDFGKGAVVAIVMLLPSLVSIVIQNKLDQTNFRYSKISHIELKPCRNRDILLGTVSIGILLSLLSMFAVIFLIPFIHQWPYDKSFSVAVFMERVSDSGIMQTLSNTLVVAFATAALGTVMVYACGLITERSAASQGIKSAINGMALLTNAIPGMVLGVAFMLTFSGTPLQNTLVLIIFSNLVHFFSAPYFMAKNALAKLNSSWETTGQLMGDSWSRTVIRVLIPNSIRTIWEIFAYYFINAMVTVSAVVFIAGARTMVLTTRIKEFQHYGKFEDIFVLSLLIFAINLTVKAAVKLISGKRERIN